MQNRIFQICLTHSERCSSRANVYIFFDRGKRILQKLLKKHPRLIGDWKEIQNLDVGYYEDGDNKST